jgi:hypothetical protein
VRIVVDQFAAVAKTISSTVARLRYRMALVIRMLRMLLPRDASHSALRFSRLAHPARGMPPDPDTLRVPFLACFRTEYTMRFAVRGDDALDTVVNIRLTSAEKAKLADDADLAALSMSELLRDASSGALRQEDDGICVRASRRPAVRDPGTPPCRLVSSRT